jgi:hypothetical protein
MPHQVAITIRAPIRAGAVAALSELLAELGRKGAHDRAIPFGELPGVHFARFFVLEEVKDLDGRPIPASLVYLSDVDAPLDRHLRQLGGKADVLDEVFGYCEDYPVAASTVAARVAWLRRHLVSSAVTYVNTVGRGLDQIRQEARLREALQDFLDEPGRDWSGRTPAEVRREIQRFVASRPDLAWAMSPPRRPGIVFRVRETAHKVALPLLVLLLLPGLIVALPVWAVLLRWHERRDKEEAKRADPARVAELTKYEDHVAQNAFTAIGFVKAGIFRRVTMRVVLAVVSYAVRHFYNAGTLAGVRTIHFARWVPIDGGRRLFFASNYDGSQESYMSEFIDRLAWGLNAVFSNGHGYPRVRWLIKGGAENEQAFKNYLRSHQVPAPVWYSAYDNLTADNVAANARIRAGLHANLTPAQVTDWLALL